MVSKHFKWAFSLLLVSIMVFSFAPIANKKYKYKAYFGCHYSDVVTLDVNAFKEFMKIPFCAKDSMNNFYKVKGFEIVYAERGLYQDDEGLPIVYTDYTSDKFINDTLTTYWKHLFSERIYKGDTIFFENIICAGYDNKHYECKPIKIILK
ncbi:MAG TPA: hypothetical protein PKA54_08335 [Chitinophagaceae bacterium]|nr:hypothetical protein [Chitinophagaceae bacterium]